MLTGTIKFFEQARNFGMIEQNQKGPDVFFHRSDLEDCVSLTAGVWVQFELVPGYRHKNGTLRAMRVAVCGPKKVRAYGTD